MGLWTILRTNITHKARSFRPTEPVPYPEHYRGALLHDTGRCVACGICAYACAPAAISLDPDGECSVRWSYFAEQCTYCGRCVDYCPNEALSFAAEAPVMTGNRALHRTDHHVKPAPCSRCGRLVLPAPDLVSAAIADPQLARLCTACRRKATAERVKRAFTGK